MRKAILGLSGAVMFVPLALGACSQASEETAEVTDAPSNKFGFAEATETPSDSDAADAAKTINIEEPAEDSATGNVIPVSAPQIAYVYDYGFRIAADAIAPLQQRHADLCEKKGQATCRIISMEQSGAEGDYAYGQLKLAIAADKARAFGSELAGAAEAMDGEAVSQSIGGEDLSKQIVDTEARLRARTLLRDRLMDILRNRSGTVAELVEAERGVAQVNEEIDQASSWLAEMRGRVAFSNVTIEYNSGSRSSGSFTGPIQSAFSSISSILGMLIAAMIVGLTILVPLGLLFFALRWAWRRIAPHVRNNKDTLPNGSASTAAGNAENASADE